jgi:hypothetical protein
MKVNLIPYILEHKNNKTFIQGRKFDFDDASWGEVMDIPRRVLTSARPF